MDSLIEELTTEKRDTAVNQFVGAYALEGQPLNEAAVRAAVRQVAPYSAAPEHAKLMTDLFAELVESERRWEGAQLRQVVEALLLETVEAGDDLASADALKAANATAEAGRALSEAERAADTALADETKARVLEALKDGDGGGLSKVQQAVEKHITEVYPSESAMKVFFAKSQLGQSAPDVVKARLLRHGINADHCDKGAGAANLKWCLNHYAHNNLLLRAIVDPLLRSLGTFAARYTGLSEMDGVGERVVDIFSELGLDARVTLLAKPAMEVSRQEKADRDELKVRPSPTRVGTAFDCLRRLQPSSRQHS